VLYSQEEYGCMDLGWIGMELGEFFCMRLPSLFEIRDSSKRSARRVVVSDAGPPV
jgi:hypothetical protein